MRSFVDSQSAYHDNIFNLCKIKKARITCRSLHMIRAFLLSYTQRAVKQLRSYCEREYIYQVYNLMIRREPQFIRGPLNDRRHRRESMFIYPIQRAVCNCLLCVCCLLCVFLCVLCVVYVCVSVLMLCVYSFECLVFVFERVYFTAL